MISPFLPIPTTASWLEWMWRRDPSVGLCMLAVGLVLLFVGWRVFKFVAAITFALAGACIGAQLAAGTWAATLAAIAGAIALGGISWRLMRYAVAVWGGAAGAFAVAGTVAKFSSEEALMLVAAAAGFAAMAALSFVMFRNVVIFATSLQGALLIVSGVAGLARLSDSFFAHFRPLAEHSPLFVPLAILTPTVIGVCLQLADMQQKESGQPAG